MEVKSVNNFRPSFKSGLTDVIIKDIQSINIAKAKSDLARMGIDANVGDNKALCANLIYAANILSEISSRYKLPFFYVPPTANVFVRHELINPKNALDGFCIADTEKVLKNKSSYVGGSVFFNDFDSQLYNNDLFCDVGHARGWKSSSHFLSNTLHEWFHCIHTNLIYKRDGYEGECPILRKQYYKKGAHGKSTINVITNLPSFPNREELAKKIGVYAAFSHSLMEVFAELMTKLTVKSLDSKLNVTKNPLDNMPQDLPKSVTIHLEKFLGI